MVPVVSTAHPRMICAAGRLPRPPRGREPTIPFFSGARLAEAGWGTHRRVEINPEGISIKLYIFSGRTLSISSLFRDRLGQKRGTDT